LGWLTCARPEKSAILTLGREKTEHMIAIPSDPIAVLDSGLGGLTVLGALRHVLPAEDLIYFGDTAHLPYGNKSPGAIMRYVGDITKFLLLRRPKHLVIACNTATAIALPALCARFPELSITGVIEPGARAAVAAAGSAPQPIIGVIATEGTVKSKAYERAILRRRNHAKVLLRPTPLLAPMIEEGRTGDDPLIEMALRQYLQGMIQRKIDVLVLGCTHYPIVAHAIAKVTGPLVRLIDSAEQCAQDVAGRLARKQLLRYPAPDPDDTVGDVLPSAGLGSVRMYVSDDPDRFVQLASRLLGYDLERPTLVTPDELRGLALEEPPRLRATG
jgi:glutamate racemase